MNRSPRLRNAVRSVKDEIAALVDERIDFLRQARFSEADIEAFRWALATVVAGEIVGKLSVDAQPRAPMVWLLTKSQTLAQQIVDHATIEIGREQHSRPMEDRPCVSS
jgi:hypothetical protein